MLSCDVLWLYIPLGNCHITRSVEVLRIVCYESYYNELFRDCAPYAAYFVRPPKLAIPHFYKIFIFIFIINVNFSIHFIVSFSIISVYTVFIVNIGRADDVCLVR